MSKFGRGYLWRRCPYSTQSTSYGDTRIPVIEKTDHTTYDGRMVAASRGGKSVGFECQDSIACPYYLGTATTEITLVKHKWGGDTVVTGTISIVSGQFFYES